ncbi:DUF1919 domain-containing protein [Cetobacterium sp.]|uniref:DUF1919 domain-containing protein n=1 Tax=Cetobacterium sp. TaxID=2071632 RepID=UPI003F40A018
MILSKIRYFFIKNKEVSVISNNCWGGFMYQRYNLKYNSPFIGLFIYAPDYIKLLKNLEQNLKSQLKFIKKEESKYRDKITLNEIKYPIGLLGEEIEIHFLHYKTKEEAEEKWQKRLKRIDFQNLVVKFSDRDLCNEDLIYEFDKLKYEKKICLTSREYKKLKSVYFIKECEGKESVYDEWKYSEKYIPFYKITK